MASQILALTLGGTLRLSDPKNVRTAGKFSKLIHDNADVFQRFFGTDLFPGSLNVDVPDPPTLQTALDSCSPAPTIVIPRAELVGMPDYIGEGRAWPCRLRGARLPKFVDCWIFRRRGSRVPAGVIEIVAREGLRAAYDLQHRDPVVIEVFAPVSS